MPSLDSPPGWAPPRAGPRRMRPRAVAPALVLGLLTATLVSPPLRTGDQACYYPCGWCEAARVLAPATPQAAGPDVLYAQELLRELGLFAGSPSGLYDDATARAVEALQTAGGLPATGTLDLGTWDLAEARAAARSAAARRPAPPGFVSIVIDTQRLTLTVFSDEDVWHRFPVAVGKASTPTPLGEWKIAHKSIWSGGFGTRWLGLSMPWATYGIHGTNRPSSVGRSVSHGCVRMQNRDVETLFRWVKVGTPVRIVGQPRPHFGETPRRSSLSSVGSDVMGLQQALKDLGLYRQRVDGRFGGATERALRQYQWATLIPVTGIADKATRQALGLP